MCDEFKSSIKLEFDMSKLGSIKYYFGIGVLQSSCGVFIFQRKHVHEILSRFGMEESNPIKNPIVPCTELLKDKTRTKLMKLYSIRLLAVSCT